MYSPKHLRLIQAEEYFKKAAKYALAESNTGAIKLQAAESYLFAARSCYIQGKLNEAADFASKGFNLVPQLVEAGFTQAKALAANNNEIQAANVLEKVINTDRFYSLKTLSDLDLCPKPSIQSLLKKLQREATDKATNILQDCKQQIISGSNASEYIEKIGRLVNKNTYLTSKKAIDLLNKVQDWSFCEPFKNSMQTVYLNEIIEFADKLKALQYYKSGNNFYPLDNLSNLDFLNKINLETQWLFPSHITKNEKWINNITSKEVNCDVIHFIEFEKIYFDDLPNVINDLKNLVQQYSNDNIQHLDYLMNKKLKAEKAIRDADNDNIDLSIGNGILWGLVGIVIGYIGGGIIGFIISLFVKRENSDFVFNSIVWTVTLICG